MFPSCPVSCLCPTSLAFHLHTAISFPLPEPLHWMFFGPGMAFSSLLCWPLLSCRYQLLNITSSKQFSLPAPAQLSLTWPCLCSLNLWAVCDYLVYIFITHLLSNTHLFLAVTWHHSSHLTPSLVSGVSFSRDLKCWQLISSHTDTLRSCPLASSPHHKATLSSSVRVTLPPNINLQLQNASSGLNMVLISLKPMYT